MCVCVCDFNSQPHKEADPQALHFAYIGFISTHSLTRRLTLKTTGNIALQQHFNSQPHKEADLRNRRKKPLRWHFNSQPHKEADGSVQLHSDTYSISTHSLTRRLTVILSNLSVLQEISTHSLTRRLTIFIWGSN